MSKEYKQCSNGHYFQGDTCPFCKDYVHMHCPYCRESIEIGITDYDTHLPWSGKCANCGHDFSIDNDVVRYYSSLSCPHCGKQVTDNVNEKWDGKCVNCGHNFTIDWMIIQKIEKEWKSRRRTRDEAASLSFMLSEQEIQMQKNNLETHI